MNKELADRAEAQIKLTVEGWKLTLRTVLLDLVSELEQEERNKEFWKREFYKQEARAKRAEQLSIIQETRANKAEENQGRQIEPF